MFAVRGIFRATVIDESIG